MTPNDQVGFNLRPTRERLSLIVSLGWLFSTQCQS